MFNGLWYVRIYHVEIDRSNLTSVWRGAFVHFISSISIALHCIAKLLFTVHSVIDTAFICVAVVLNLGPLGSHCHHHLSKR